MDNTPPDNSQPQKCDRSRNGRDLTSPTRGGFADKTEQTANKVRRIIVRKKDEAAKFFAVSKKNEAQQENKILKMALLWDLQQLIDTVTDFINHAF